MMPLPDPGLLGGGLIAALVGGALGWAQTTITGGWLAACARALGEGAPEPSSPGTPAGAVDRSATIIPLATVAVVVGLWWWEVRCLGEIPRDATGLPLAVPLATNAGRWLAHALLFWLLTAATWIDFRYRVIPDWVTIPGFLAGLFMAWLLPETLLPIGAEVTRPFATAMLEPDVLGWAGPLSHGSADAPSGGTTPVMLLVALVLFTVWWVVGTGPDLAGVAEALPAEDGLAPAAAPPSPSSWWPRLGLLALGWSGVVGAWAIGGLRFEGLLTALVGAVVAGGIVWGTRAGASLALGREAMGLGDVTLMAMVGAWLGWQASVLACFLGVLFGLLHAVVQLVRHRGNELPFGPGLCMGTAAVIVGWRPLWQATAASFADTGQLVGIVVAVVVGTALSLWVWSSLGPAARRAALAVMILLAVVLVGLLLLLQA